MKTLFQEVEEAWQKIGDGWCSLDKAKLLVSCIAATRPRWVVEIGVWGGKSLIPMAIACRRIGYGTVIGIDPWLAEASVQGMTGQDFEWWGKVDHDRIYQAFTAHIRDMQLHDWVIIHRRKSDDVYLEDSLYDGIGLLHLDGNHSEQADNDIKRYAGLVPKGGLVFCDDVNWTGGGVAKAIDRLTKMGFDALTNEGTGALFKRIA